MASRATPLFVTARGGADDPPGLLAADQPYAWWPASTRQGCRRTCCATPSPPTCSTMAPTLRGVQLLLGHADFNHADYTHVARERLKSPHAIIRAADRQHKRPRGRTDRRLISAASRTSEKCWPLLAECRAGDRLHIAEQSAGFRLDRSCRRARMKR